MTALAQDLPDAPGKAVVEKLCADCHGVASIGGLRRTRSGWEATVDEMVARGANGSDEEFDRVIAYLARYLGKVNVNQGSSKEIQEVADLSAAEADAIVKYRAQNGDFKDLADLRKVPGLDLKKLDQRKDRFAFK
jgi:competence ComEA-like helix-hairpin-helix protein